MSHLTAMECTRLQAFWMKFGTLPAEYPMPPREDPRPRCVHGSIIVEPVPFAWEVGEPRLIFCACCGSALLFTHDRCQTCASISPPSPA